MGSESGSGEQNPGPLASSRVECLAASFEDNFVILKPTYSAEASLNDIADFVEFFRAAAPSPHFRPTTGAWSYPRSTGSVLAAAALADQFNCRLDASEEFSTELKQIEDATAKEDAIRRILQPYLDDHNKPLADYPSMSPKPPWRHQKISWHWAMRTAALYFAHKPGLGKTRTGADVMRGAYELGLIRRPVSVPLQARYCYEEPDKVIPARAGTVGGVLIVCPRVVLDTWRDEILKFQGIAALIIKGIPARKRQLAGISSAAHIVTYGSLNYVIDNKYDLVIADEAHYVASEDSVRFDRLMRIRQNAQRVIFLSGTPVSNMLPSLWAQYYMLDYGRSLGPSRKAYLAKYFDKNKPKNGALEEISAKISRITYFLRKEDALPFLPKKLPPQRILVPMTEQQKAYYNRVREDAHAQVMAGNVSTPEFRTKMMKLAQICQGWVKADNGDIVRFSSAKLTALESMITGQGDLAGRKVIVWVSFKEDAQAIGRMLTKHRIPGLLLAGGMTDNDREQLKHEWNNNPAYRVLVGMMQVGIGINLHAKDCRLSDGTPDRCSTAIYYGLDQSSTVLEQSMDRIHRGDQVEECLYRFILSTDIDEAAEPIQTRDTNIYERLIKKLETSEEVYENGSSYYADLLKT